MPDPLVAPSRTCPDAVTLWMFLHEELTPGASWVPEHVNSCHACQQTVARLAGRMPSPMAPTLPMASDFEEDRPPRLPGHETIRWIDAGGMGVVWRIRDLQLRRDLAVKVMKSRAAGNPELVQRFIKEAQICAQLTHPFIVPVHGMGQLPDGRLYYTMKLVEGQTLAAQLHARPTPSHRRMESILIFSQVCQALAFAHRKGVLHRDLKPQNIMVGEHGEVLVMDWGLATVMPGADPVFPTRREEPQGTAHDTQWGAGSPTHDGCVLGTPAYMPPEQARGPLTSVDRRSDVFGLGAILCEILTGEPPYRGLKQDKVLQQATAANLSDAWERLHGCGADAELIRLAERCLAPNKADRPADAGEVARAASAYLASSVLTAVGLVAAGGLLASPQVGPHLGGTSGLDGDLGRVLAACLQPTVARGRA